MGGLMRIESSVTAISWIPSEAVHGLPKLPFEIGLVDYDEPPPDEIDPDELEDMREANRFREANHLAAWIEVEGGKVVDHGYSGGGLVGSTRVHLGPKDVVVPGVAFDVLRPEPDVYEDVVRFKQTVGGRAGFPAPRRVKGKPLFRIQPPTAWTTLSLTINADGSSYHELVGASPFPRHWIYDRRGRLVEKAGTIDFKAWYRETHGEKTPWGHEDSDVYVTAAESAFERELSRELMAGGYIPERRVLEPDETLIEQGDEAREMYLLLDGVLVAEVDGVEAAEIGPGAIVGERALIQGTMRTATLMARTRCRVAVIPAEIIDIQELEDLAEARGE